MPDQLPEDDVQAQFWLKARGIKRVDENTHLSVAQAQEILRSIGIEGSITVTIAHEYNHVYRIQCKSAGASAVDILSVCRELAQNLPAQSRWWESLFQGYGSTPNFERFRLRLLNGWYPYAANVWPGSGDTGFNHILTATNWDELFSDMHVTPH
ncbi:MAG: hypothetical protein NVS4B11_37080 [Ktedonobacteraceae bacterium]